MFTTVNAKYRNSRESYRLGNVIPFFQAKLTVNEPGDQYEQEADAVADKVMRMPTPSVSDGKMQLKPIPLSQISRKCADCEKEEEKIQRKENASGGGQTAPSIVHDVISSSGQSLDGGTRHFMESRMGHDFSNVQVHIDRKAAESAASVNALAYTSGNHIVFNSGQYQPGTKGGKRLLAHELVHTVQQNAIESIHNIQRDLATPLPTNPVVNQADLSLRQIQDAIVFNRVRYDDQDTRLIQDILGGPVTGVWSIENIEAISNTQEEYGLPADGKVGFETFRFINNEQRLEGMNRRNSNCLTSLRVLTLAPPVFNRNATTNTCDIWGWFRTESQFSERCTCSDFEYRQFIRGHFRRTRGGVQTDISGFFSRLPGGVLPANYIEDGDVTDNPQNYGHRDNIVDTDPEDHYIDNRGNDDQANGCRYRNFDRTGGVLTDCQAGDIYDLNMNFRGEIQRNGIPVSTRAWTVFNFQNHAV